MSSLLLVSPTGNMNPRIAELFRALFPDVPEMSYEMVEVLRMEVARKPAPCEVKAKYVPPKLVVIQLSVHGGNSAAMLKWFRRRQRRQGRDYGKVAVFFPGVHSQVVADAAAKAGLVCFFMSQEDPEASVEVARPRVRELAMVS